MGYVPGRLGLIFERQWLHALGLAVLLAAFAWVMRFDAPRAGQLWGLGAAAWAWIAVGLAVAHQVWVWFCWRTELHATLLSRTLGPRGFTLYAVVFSILGIARVVAVYLLAFANRDRLDAAPAVLIVLKCLAVIVALPALYLFYCVRRYFGFRRAFGIDHFDPACRTAPLVRRGIFRVTDNAMYTFGFGILWLPALWCAAPAALAVAAFNHAYIWVHFFATERPDMRRIYVGA